MCGHRDQGAIGENELRVVSKPFGAAKDIIPTPTIEARRMIAEFVQNLIHLKRGQDGFDKNCCPDRASGNAQFVLSQVKDVVPEPGFKVAFHFWQVEIRPASSRQQLFGVMKNIEPEIEQPAGNRFAVDEEMF